MKVLDYLATQQAPEALQPHPLQALVEEIIEEELTDHEKEIFYLRFGEGLSFRDIADRLEYSSHQTFHYQVEKIQEKVRAALERYRGDTEGSD